jgi:iron complex outermembrane receptor protein
MKKLLLNLIFLISLFPAYGQIIRGVITDSSNNQGAYGATILEKGTANGVAAEFDGKFQLRLTKGFPDTLIISGLGYTTQEVVVLSAKEDVVVKLEVSQVTLKELTVTDSRLTNKQKESPLTVESMDAIAIKQTSSVTFYEGLGNLKGVDLTSASIGFKVINTRGFNSTSPVRSLQIIDGVDNASPGLNFSLGNFLGASELDIQKVDLVQGASGAYFGPNAFNGVISMVTKNPFDYQGITASVKYGERNLFEGAFRFAQKFKDKKGFDRFAYKVNFYYLRADDWHATNYSPSTDSKTNEKNPGGYDAVNKYGDEALASGYDFYTDSSQRVYYPGLGYFYRDGYKEEDIVNYNTQNIKANVALHYKTRKGVEVMATSNFGYGTTVYQGENRYSLKDIMFFQNKIEVREKDKFFIRFYSTNEDAGNSYDAVVTAFLMQNNNKAQGPPFSNPFGSWNNDYLNYWQNNIANNGSSGHLFDVCPTLFGVNFPQSGANYNWGRADSLLTLLADSLALWHQQARDYANNHTIGGQSPYFNPGTTQFDTAFAGITSRPLGQGGSKLFDLSALFHLHGEYKWRFKTADEKTSKRGWYKFTQGLSTIDWTVGANGRLYTPNTSGTIFIDTGNVKITNWEFGVYLGFEKRWEKIKLNGTMRMDKNQNFPFLFSPAISLVYMPHKNHIIRFSAASAIRNPTLADQYLNYNVGRAVLAGNINGYDSLITVNSFYNYLDSLGTFTALRYFNVAPVRPEQVKTFEVGYRGTFWKRWYVDMSYYVSLYQDFIGYKIGIKSSFDQVVGLPSPNTTVYRVATNAVDPVLTMGFSIQSSVYFAKHFSFSGNYTWNRLNDLGSKDPLIPAFNTPEHKFNIGIDGRDIQMKLGKLKINNWGFNVNFKWIDGFQYTGSPQFTGLVPSYYMLDAQLNYTLKKAHLTFKLGAQNLTNNLAFQVYGGPRVGRLVYFSILFDWNVFKKN